MSDTVTVLRLRAASRVLDVEWMDGTTSVLPYELLRECCPCAECRQQRRVAGALTASAGVAVTAVVPLGANAIRVCFSDGHDRGIFPFSYLRELETGAP